MKGESGSWIGNRKDINPIQEEWVLVGKGKGEVIYQMGHVSRRTVPAPVGKAKSTIRWTSNGAGQKSESNCQLKAQAGGLLLDVVMMDRRGKRIG